MSIGEARFQLSTPPGKIKTLIWIAQLSPLKTSLREEARGSMPQA